MCSHLVPLFSIRLAMVQGLKMRELPYHTVLALKFGYYSLGSRKAVLISMSDDIRILAHGKTRGD
jgi:hypothetical protein